MKVKKLFEDKESTFHRRHNALWGYYGKIQSKLLDKLVNAKTEEERKKIETELSANNKKIDELKLKMHNEYIDLKNSKVK